MVGEVLWKEATYIKGRGRILFKITTRKNMET
jgi:hypothetical protein